MCKPNNITDHRQAMDEAVATALMQQANEDRTDETNVASDESDDSATNNVENPYEEL